MKIILKLAGCVAAGALLGAVALAADEPAPAPGRTTSVPLAPDAPAEYVVQRGDTLWGISSKYLRDPWYWPEIWYLNPEVENPHLIFPGDTLRLVYDASGRPQIRVERGNTVRLSPQVRTSPIDEALPAIPYEIATAFLSKPTVIAADQANGLPYVVAFNHRRTIGGMGDVIYARGVGDSELGTRYNIVHLGERLRDPDDGSFLGFQGVYAGAARVDVTTPGRDGDPELTKLEIVESARETLRGDRLIDDRLEVPLDFIPHAPPEGTSGRIISVVNGMAVIGQYQVVVINRGKQHGIEPGHVFSIWREGADARDLGPVVDWTRGSSSTFARTVRLPEERAGRFMVFRVYDRLSFGLVMSATDVIRVGDFVQNP